MRQLIDAGLVTREQREKWAYYRLVHSTLVAVAGALTPLGMVGAYKAKADWGVRP